MSLSITWNKIFWGLIFMWTIFIYCYFLCKIRYVVNVALHKDGRVAPTNNLTSPSCSEKGKETSSCKWQYISGEISLWESRVVPVFRYRYLHLKLGRVLSTCKHPFSFCPIRNENVESFVSEFESCIFHMQTLSP